LTKPQKLAGVIKEVSYHGAPPLMKVEVDKKILTIVLAPPPRMEFRLLSDEMLKAGESVSVVAYPSKQNKDELRAESITIGKMTTELR
jgi:hypothetical protein